VNYSGFNATIIIQIIHLLILVFIVAGILTIILKWPSKKNISKRIETMENEIKEIKRILKKNELRLYLG